MKLLSVQLAKQDSTGILAKKNVPYIAARVIAYAESKNIISRDEWDFLDQDTADYGGDLAVVSSIEKTASDIVLFSLFDWNLERSIWLTKRLRRTMPKTYFIAIGPAVLQNSIAYKSNVFDALIEGDPEALFVDALNDIKSLSLQQKYVNTPETILDDAPNPYLSAILPISSAKPVFIESTRGRNSTPVFITNTQSRNFSRDTAARVLRLASEQGASEARILAPCLNERPDFKDFIKVLAAANEGEIILSASMSSVKLEDEIYSLLNDAGFMLLEMELGSVNEKALLRVGISNNKANFEHSATQLWSHGIAVKPKLYLGLPYDTYDSLIEGFDFLGMIGMGQEANLIPMPVPPGTKIWKNAVDYGVVNFLDRPPYWVMSTEWMDEDDFLSAISDFEEGFDVAWGNTVCPTFKLYRGGFISCIDFRHTAIANLVIEQKLLASSVTLVVDMHDMDAIIQLCNVAKKIKKDSLYGLWQIVLCSNSAIPSPSIMERLTDSFVMTDHYFELSKLYALDPQPDFQTRLFFATPNAKLALEAINNRPDIETIFVIDSTIPNSTVLEAMPFIAFDREKMPFDILYDIMSRYRDYPELILDTAGLKLS